MTDELAILGGPPTLAADQHERWPQLTELDREAVTRVIDRGVISGARAPEISALEDEWAAYVDAEHCIAVNNGTAALHCCAAAAQLGPGDEVIVPALTFIATAMAMLHQGATPVFCDIDPKTYNLAPELVEERITDRTRAIVPVHLHGLPADLDALSAIAERHDLALIEDAAQAHGAEFRGRRVGAIGASGAFSMNATKGLPGGEGGFFVTDDEDAYRAARRLTMFGEDVPALESGQFRAYWSEGLGWNYRNQELPAALTRAQLQRLDRYNATAQANAEHLTRHLEGVPGLIPPTVPSDRTSVYHKYRVRLDTRALGYDGSVTELRDRLIHALRAEGVEAVVWQVYPLPALPVFRRPVTTWHPRGDLPVLDEWDPQEFPASAAALDETFIIGSETMPLYVQREDVMRRYTEAIDKVMANLDSILALPHQPISFGWVEGSA
jgi:perosamine synthetase